MVLDLAAIRKRAEEAKAQASNACSDGSWYWKGGLKELSDDVLALLERMRAEETEKWIDLYTKAQAENAKLRAVVEATAAAVTQSRYIYTADRFDNGNLARVKDK